MPVHTERSRLSLLGHFSLNLNSGQTAAGTGEEHTGLRNCVKLLRRRTKTEFTMQTDRNKAIMDNNRVPTSYDF